MNNVSIDRRRLLLGLAAAASTAAATSSANARNVKLENPDLLALAAQLPAIAARFHSARAAYDAMDHNCQANTPFAPHELTLPGTALPIDNPDQPGDTELTAMGGYLIRDGEKFPRRIVVRSWHVSAKIADAQRHKRRAKKEQDAVEYWRLDEEIERLKTLHKTAEVYEKAFASVKASARLGHEALYPELAAARSALEAHIDAIMNAQDWTAEGLIIKAEALAEWGNIGRDGRLTFTNWYAQIAELVLRHAKGVTS